MYGGHEDWYWDIDKNLEMEALAGYTCIECSQLKGLDELWMQLMPNLHKIIKAGMEKMTREMLLTITNGYEKKYIEKYGEYMPRHTGFMLDEEEREATYKKALETGKTWREITGYPEKGGI